MKKIILFMLVALTSVVSANAQVAYEKAKVLDNVYVGVNAGVTTPLTFDQVFPLNPTFSVRLGKEFTPIFGMNVEGTAWFGSNDTQARFDGVVIKDRFDTMNGSHNIFRGVNVGVNGTINLTNLFLDFNGAPRKFEVITQTGIGWGHVFAPGDDKDNLTAKTGLDFTFNLGSQRQHSLFVEPAVLWTLTNHQHDGVKFDKREAQLALSVGYVYHFKTSNGTHTFKAYDIGAMNNEINNLKAELAKKPQTVTVIKERVVEKIVPSTTEWVVSFEQNKADLLDDAKAVLDGISTNTAVEVVATASPEGTDLRNKVLSQERADVVADYLTNRGVKVLSKEGLGVVGKNSQRVAKVIVK
jgi:outer membrane protein OmpA-like peptidoglycan-associated protein